jgi:SAM-dependent methyltransferase
VARCGLPVLDAGCGAGRHLDALRRRGLPVLGLDLSADLLGTATGRAAAAGRLVRADLRQPPLRERGFAAVALLFTAFGYFDDRANAECLARLARLVAAGGCLLLDLPDPDHLAATLVPASERRTPAGLVVAERRRLDGARVEKAVEVRHPDGRVRNWRESVRLYRRDELAELTRRAGLEPWDCWTSLEGPDRPGTRLVWWARRG